MSSYRVKISDYYYIKIWQLNDAYLEQHGVGPYASEWRFDKRTKPWLDTGYYRQVEKLLKQDYNVTIDSINDTYMFDSDEDMMAFVLEWA
jgi:hypothetical protein